MTTKWVSTELKNFDDISNILSMSGEEVVLDLLAKSSARRPVPCGRITYSLPGGARLSHGLDFLIKAPRTDNWQFQPTFVRLGKLLAERYISSCKEHATRAEPVTKSAFEEGKAYYERNKDFLRRKYNGEYIAIWNNDVLDHDTSFSSLAQRVYKKLGYVSIYMPFVTSKRRVLRFESPRVRRSTAGVS